MKRSLLSIVFLFSGLITAIASGHVATAVGTNPTCNGLCNGSAVALASGGVGPYGFTWTGPASYSATGANISGLCAGTYIVTAIDSSDMSTATYTLNLTQPSPVVVSVSSGVPICAGESTSLLTSVTGGTPGYTYSWSPATGLSNASNPYPVASPAITTTYTVTITDANGCTGTAQGTVIVNPSPVVSVNSPTICAGQAAILTASGATAYTWSTGSSSNPYTVTPATTTSYTVTGGTAGCTGTAVATVTVAASPAVTLTQSPTACGSCTGSISTTASGGSTFNWTGPSGYTSTVMNPSGLCAGSYTVVTTFGGCSSTISIPVSTSASVFSTIGSVVPSSCGACDGGATVFATGGTPPYTYTWSGALTTATVTNFCPGSYTVVVTDQMGCTSVSVASIPSASGITGSMGMTPTGCSVCYGSANITVSGGTGPYTYDWFPGTPIGDGTPSISNLCVGTYTVLVTDAVGCTYSNFIFINPDPIIATASATPSACGACNGTVSVMGFGGLTPYLFDLTGYPQQTNGNFSGICAGTYIATITDGGGCTGTYTIVVPSTSSSAITAVSTLQNETGYGFANGSIDLTVSGSAPPFTYLWSNGATTEDIYSLSAGTYSVVVMDGNGECSNYSFVINTIAGTGLITGYLYHDLNGNCVFDTGDIPITGAYAYASNGTTTVWGLTNASGYYSIVAPAGNYSVNPYSALYLAAGCTSVYSLTVTAGTSWANNNFAYVVPSIYDVCIWAYSTGIVPGFNGSYNVHLNNPGTQTAIGTAYIVIPPMLTYMSSFPAASSISGDTIFWNYSISPGATQWYSATFYTPPTTPLGMITVAYVNATVTNGTDINPGCNSYVYTRAVTGSFDPNDKTVNPSGATAAGNIPLTSTEFSYLINFQNTGSGPAVDINITDTLSALLDPLSLQVLNSSHPYIVEFISGNVVRFKFNNIMLPDSTSDEPGSHGHVQFKIAKLNSPSYGEVIQNTAYIYFDFNEPVITNTATNTYALATSMANNMNQSGSVHVYPNPFSDNTTFVIDSETREMYTFEMTDVLGKNVKTIRNISEKQFNVSREGLLNGIYFYKIYSTEGFVGLGKVIIK